MCGCNNHSDITLLLQADGQVRHRGKVLSDSQLEQSLRNEYLRNGNLPVRIQVASSLRYQRFVQVEDICIRYGFWTLHVGLPGDSLGYLYPRCWNVLPCDPIDKSVWDNVVNWSNLTVASSAGVNVAIREESVVLDKTPSVLSAVIVDLAKLANTTRNRVVVRAEPGGQCGSLVAILKVCADYRLNVMVVEGLDAEVIVSGNENVEQRGGGDGIPSSHR